MKIKLKKGVILNNGNNHHNLDFLEFHKLKDGYEIQVDFVADSLKDLVSIKDLVKIKKGVKHGN